MRDEDYGWVLKPRLGAIPGTSDGSAPEEKLPDLLIQLRRIISAVNRGFPAHTGKGGGGGGKPYITREISRRLSSANFQCIEFHTISKISEVKK
jgi:hypothetical protein